MENNKITLATFNGIAPRFIELMDEPTFKKECSFALQHLAKNSYLASATQNSIIESVLNIAQVGLTLNPAMKLAYLVPRRVGSQVVCCLEPSYQGLCKLVTDTGSVKNIYAQMVYENDQFEQILGTENTIIHRPKLGNRGSVVGCYAVARLKDGSTQVEVMDIQTISDIRATSESYKSYLSGKINTCVWVSHFDEMARKTVVRRICKYLPKTNAWEQLSNAIELDNEDYIADYYQLERIDELLKFSSMAEEKKEFISRYMSTYTKEQANRVIIELENSQVDPVLSGLNYNQSDIKKSKKGLA